MADAQTIDALDEEEQQRRADEHVIHLNNCDLGMQRILQIPVCRIWLWQLLLDLGMEGAPPNFEHPNLEQYVFWKQGAQYAVDKIIGQAKDASPEGYIQLQSEGLDIGDWLSTIPKETQETNRRKRGRRGGRRAREKREKKGRPENHDGSAD